PLRRAAAPAGRPPRPQGARRECRRRGGGRRAQRLGRLGGRAGRDPRRHRRRHAGVRGRRRHACAAPGHKAARDAGRVPWRVHVGRDICAAAAVAATRAPLRCGHHADSERQHVPGPADPAEI
ncbi:hypothetical protein IWW50_007142, partial [Coemansia erecta]